MKEMRVRQMMHSATCDHSFRSYNSICRLTWLTLLTSILLDVFGPLRQLIARGSSRINSHTIASTQIHSRPRKSSIHLIKTVLPLQHTRDPFWNVASLASRSMGALLRAQKLAAILPETTWYLGNYDAIRWRHAIAISPRLGERYLLQVLILS